MKFRADIEGLRALAILFVVGYHAGVPFLPGGYVGVDVFFALSGYLISGLLLQELTRTNTVRLREFYARRARRLLPATAVVVFVTMIAGALLYAPVEHDMVANSAIAATAYASNVYFARVATDYLATPTHTNPLLHTWSLSVEEQFYFLWPVMMVAVAALASPAKRRRWLLATMAAVAVVSFALCVVWTHSNQPWAFFLPFSRAWEFALGGMAALLTSAAPPVTRRTAGALGIAGAAGMMTSAVGFGATTTFPGVAAALPALSTVAVLVAGELQPANAVAGVLGMAPLQAIGRVSYSWYLWHWPALILAAVALGPLSPLQTGVAILLSLIAALVSYHVVEQPIRHHATLSRRAGMTLALAGLLAIVTVSAGVGWKRQAARWEALPSQSTYSQMHNDFPAIYGMGCDRYFHSAEVVECAFGAADAARTAVLIGDSHAGHWFPAMQELFERRGWRLVVLTKSACPVVDTTYFFTDIGRMYTECREWVNASIARIARIKPALVVVSFYSGYQFHEGDWVAGLRRAVDGLANTGAPVVMLRDLPLLPFDGPTCLARQAWSPLASANQHGCVARAASDDPMYREQRLAVAGHRHAATIDMTPDVCPNDLCELVQDGVVTYRDAGHLTTVFSRRLAAALGQRLQAALAAMAVDVPIPGTDQ